MDPQPTEFFSPEGVAALAVLLVAIAKLADWLLLRERKTELLDRVDAFGDYLRAIRFKQAQLDLVRALLAFLTAISVPWTLRKHPHYTGKSEDDLDATEVVALLLAAVSRPLQFVVAVAVLGLWAVGWLDFRYAGLFVVFAVVLLVRTAFWLLHLAAVGYELEPDPQAPAPPFLRWFEGSRLIGQLDLLGPRMLVISFLLTVVALEIGLAYWESPQTTAWFVAGQAGVAPRAPLTLALLNLPFDVLALMVTITMLRFALRREIAVSLVACADIVATIAIAFVLLVVLLAWPSWQLQVWASAAAEAAGHLAQVYTFSADPGHGLFPLYPLLFTPFAPISFYLLLPLLIAMVFAPLLRISAHICSVMHQKEQSPFMVFAIAVAGTMIIVKALWAWPWLAERLAPHFS